MTTSAFGRGLQSRRHAAASLRCPQIPDRTRGKESSCFCHKGRKYSRNWGLPEERSPQSGAHQALNQNLVATFDSRGVDSYTVLMGPGYSDTSESMVNSVTPSTVAWATKILSKGSL